MSSLEKLKKLTKDCNASVLYKPLKGEVDYTQKSFPLKIHKKNIILPTDKDSDPFSWAIKCKEVLKDYNPYILIPGTKFDMHGTRYGRGGGWYDRFLSKADKNWLKIGVAHESSISIDELIRKEWDEPVDWIIFKNGSSWSVYER